MRQELLPGRPPGPPPLAPSAYSPQATPTSHRAPSPTATTAELHHSSAHPGRAPASTSNSLRRRTNNTRGARETSPPRASAERGFNCLANGREDTGYLKWRWRPRRCEVPRFTARAALERLRGKRVVFVGDSMSRTQWESFICMLMPGVDDPKTVYEVNGNEITKIIRFLGVRFASFDLTVEFFRSVFLVQQTPAPRHSPKRVKSTLRLDKMDNISRKWANADLLIFNTGHWWTPTKLFNTGCYFQAGHALKLGTTIDAAFRMALQTWASWVEKRVDLNRTHVFFRTYEPSHWSDLNQTICEVTEKPSPEAKGNDKSELGDILADVVANMNVPVNVLNVTLMGAFRTDAHVGAWSYPPTILDCSHWCLPGVPDAWNELVFSYLFTNGWRNMAG